MWIHLAAECKMSCNEIDKMSCKIDTRCMTKTRIHISGTAARSKGYRVTTWTVGELVAMLGSDFTVYPSAGHVQGIEQFFLDRMFVDGSHVSVVADARTIIRHTLNRKV